MSKRNSSDDNAFMIFLKGYWEMPVERPNLPLSFLRGAILSVIISLIFGFNSMVELLVWAALVGLLWIAIDITAWKQMSKRKGE